MYENYVSINFNLTTFFFLITPRRFESRPTLRRWSKEQRSILTQHPLISPLKAARIEWTDYKNIAAMLATDQHSHYIIISLMIAHKCFWMLHLARRMMEVVVCIHPHFSGCQKLHSEKAVLLSSRVIIYLSKQESSQHVGGSLGL